MTDPSFEIRTGPSGPGMPPSTPNFVLTVQADGVSVAARPPAGGSAGTPPTKCAWVDAAAPAGGNGFISQSQAFNTIQAALDAGAETIFIAEGAYGNINLAGSGRVLLCGLVEPGREGQALVTIGTIAVNKSGGDVCLQNVTAGAVTDTSGAAVTFTLIDATIGPFSGPGTSVFRTGTQTQNMDPAAPPVNTQALLGCASVSLSWAKVAGAVHCTALYGFRATVTGSVTSSSTVNADHCDLQQNVTCTGSGTSQVKSSTFGGQVVFDRCDVLDSTFAQDVTGDSSGNMVFRSSKFASTISSPITCDAETELRSLAAGAQLLGSFLQGLSIGQGADADVQTGNANLNFNGRLRSIFYRDSLAADATVDFSLAGAVAGQMQTYAIDVWNTAHSIHVTFASAPVVTIGPRASGQGTRYLFQVTSNNTQIVLLGCRELSGN